MMDIGCMRVGVRHTFMKMGMGVNRARRNLHFIVAVIVMAVVMAVAMLVVYAGVGMNVAVSFTHQ